MWWGCQRNNQRSPKTLLFVFRRFACRPAAFLSVWGGQPEREASLFNLKFLAIGNEQWGPEYVERLEPFVKALRKAHPEIKIVGSSGRRPTASISTIFGLRCAASGPTLSTSTITSRLNGSATMPQDMTTTTVAGPRCLQESMPATTWTQVQPL